MAEKITLKTMRCPTCGAKLKIESERKNKEIECVYCGNIVIPVSEEVAPVTDVAAAPVYSNAVKIEGIKTSSSALAYIELFFEEYDREAFTYSRFLSIPEIDKLVAELKETSADDKNTWLASFKAVALPFAHKVEGCKAILSEIVEEYKNDDLDAYSKFDAYKRISSMILSKKDSTVQSLEKIALRAAKYGASPEEINELNNEINSIKAMDLIANYADVKDIPEIKTLVEEKQRKIVAELSAKGIDAQAEYQRAKALIDGQKKAEALTVLKSLRGYADSHEIIEQLDKFYRISDVCEISGNLYFIKASETEGDGLNLYPAVDGKILDVAVLKGIKESITNYADILYYISKNGNLKKFHFGEKKESKITKKAIDTENYYLCNKKLFVIEKQGEGSLKKSLVSVDLETGDTTNVIEGISKIVFFKDNKLVYKAKEKNTANQQGGTVSTSPLKTSTKVADLTSLEITDIGTGKMTIEGFMGNKVVYTVESPNKYNKDLFIKSLGSTEPAVLIEKNIYQFCQIVADKLFYYVGSSKNRMLININIDGTDRKKWPLFITDIAFEQAGWLYFTRISGYNAVLCKARIDGSDCKIIAENVGSVISLKNGYLYYLNDESTLIKVRMDGTNSQKICTKVKEVLSVKEDKIIFISLDDKINTGANEAMAYVSKNVQSIYSVDFSGGGIRKLAYNVGVASEYDKNVICFTAIKENKNATVPEERKINELYKLNIDACTIEHILDLKMLKEEKRYHGIMFAIATIAIILMMVFLFTVPVLGILCMLVAAVAIAFGVILKRDLITIEELKKFDFSKIKDRM